MNRFENLPEDCQKLEQRYEQYPLLNRWLPLCRLLACALVIVLLLIVAITNIKLVSLEMQMTAEYEKQLEISERAMPPVKYSSIPEGIAVWGVTVLDGELYVLRNRADELEVFDPVSLVLKRRLAIPALHIGNDMTSSATHRCIYITDLVKDAIHRVTPDGGVTSWTVADGAQGLSVNAAGNLLVTFRDPSRVIEYTTLGQLVHTTSLPADIVNATHAVELTPGQLVVGHGSADAPFHRVCVVKTDGALVKCYPGNVGTSLGQLHFPVRLAVTGSGVLVDDLSNDQILLLDSQLAYVRDVIGRYDGLRSPARLHYDAVSRRLFVADNDVKDDNVVAGNVKIFKVDI